MNRILSRWFSVSLRGFAIGALMFIEMASRLVGAVTITETEYESRAHFKIATANATYVFDRAGGGFSQLLDRDGMDWVSFKKEPSTGRAAAGAAYRGIPNLVFGKDNPDAGAGHPGFDQCESSIIAPDAIRTVSKSGRWAWTWRFTDQNAVLTIEQADSERPYWFLYEGTVGGKWSPRTHYWGSNRDGPRRETPFGKDKLFDRWRWAYFGDDAAPRVLLVAQVDREGATNTLWYMGKSSAELDAPDGMIVFGFGRGPEGPLLRGPGHRFVIGFVEEAVKDRSSHTRVETVAKHWLNNAAALPRWAGSRRINMPAASSGSNKQVQPPTIDMWYGDEQHFGKLGVPQKWVNILGRVSPVDGLATLQYSLNGSAPVPLSVGADGYRLARAGDFNVDLEFDALRTGTNTLTLVATDTLGRRAERTVTVHCHRGNVWPLPYSIDWSKVRKIADVVQIVDGNWKLETNGVRTVEPYYDRILAFGDWTWTDYTVTVEATFHSYTSPKRMAPNYGVSHAAIAARFPGHFADARQPHVQWYPLGAVAEFRLADNLDQSSWRIFRDGEPATFPTTLVESSTRQVELGVCYLLKLRVDSLPGPAARYRVKSWKKSEPEPEAWEMDTKEGGATIPAGGALIVSHNTDVTFGKLTATRNSPEEL